MGTRRGHLDGGPARDPPAVPILLPASVVGLRHTLRDPRADPPRFRFPTAGRRAVHDEVVARDLRKGGQLTLDANHALGMAHSTTRFPPRAMTDPAPAEAAAVRPRSSSAVTRS